jgi:magnesium transporter
MRTILYARPGEKPGRVEGEEELSRLMKEGGGCLWVDFEDPSEDDRRVLSSLFGFHRIAVENCLARCNHPRLEDFGAYVSLTVHAITDPRPGSSEEMNRVLQGLLREDLEGGAAATLRTEEIDAFLGERFLVTWHGGPVAEISDLRRRTLEVGSIMDRGPDRILAELMDRLTGGFASVAEGLASLIDRIEDRLFTRAAQPAFRRILALKKGLIRFRHLLGPQREVLHRLGRGEFKVVSAEEAILFRDVYDRTYRVFETLESLRDMMTSALEVYLTVMSNRTNEVMRVLTVFSIILMTAGLLAGIYGMNFESIPLARLGAGFYVVVGLMGVASAALLAVFRKKRWI